LYVQQATQTCKHQPKIANKYHKIAISNIFSLQHKGVVQTFGNKRQYLKKSKQATDFSNILVLSFEKNKIQT